jgi:hypothetical protein
MAETQTAIRVKVTFPLGKKGPFEGEFPPQTTVGQVLTEAMRHFEVQPEANLTYYLTARGDRQDPNTTLAQIAGEHEHEISFRLVKEVTQG